MWERTGYALLRVISHLFATVIFLPYFWLFTMCFSIEFDSFPSRSIGLSLRFIYFVDFSLDINAVEHFIVLTLCHCRRTITIYRVERKWCVHEHRQSTTIELLPYTHTYVLLLQRLYGFRKTLRKLNSSMFVAFFLKITFCKYKNLKCEIKYE